MSCDHINFSIVKTKKGFEIICDECNEKELKENK